MKKLTLLIGLIASGKTTWAKEQQQKNTNIVRVNKDELRAMIHDGKYSKSNESFILRVRDFIISEAIDNGNDVIVDDTNFATKHKDRIVKLVDGRAKMEEKRFDVPLEECIRRDTRRENPVGEKVIRDMYEQFVQQQEKIEKIEGLPKAVIFDIDGTLAHRVDGRSPYDYPKAINDEVDKNVERILNFYRSDGYVIIIMSGRDSECRAVTEEWLYKYNIQYDYLYMRRQGDNRKDTIVKKELFDSHIRGKYNVDIVFDDRPVVIRMWRAIGLKVADVGEGIEF